MQARPRVARMRRVRAHQRSAALAAVIAGAQRAAKTPPPPLSDFHALLQFLRMSFFNLLRPATASAVATAPTAEQRNVSVSLVYESL
jgi:hypothetical protein